MATIGSDRNRREARGGVPEGPKALGVITWMISTMGEIGGLIYISGMRSSPILSKQTCPNAWGESQKNALCPGLGHQSAMCTTSEETRAQMRSKYAVKRSRAQQGSPLDDARPLGRQGEPCGRCPLPRVANPPLVEAGLLASPDAQQCAVCAAQGSTGCFQAMWEGHGIVTLVPGLCRCQESHWCGCAYPNIERSISPSPWPRSLSRFACVLGYV